MTEKYYIHKTNHLLWEDDYLPKKQITCELDEIAQKYNCDKANVQQISLQHKNTQVDVNFKAPGHNYTEVYNSLFKELQTKEIHLLEIGMGVYPTNGNSLRMWLDFFPKATIHVLDNNLNNFKCDFNYDKSRVHFYNIDQSNETSLINFSNIFSDNYFDIIIDDGSHQGAHQLLTFKILFSKLKFNSYYCIEDIFQLNYFYKLLDSINERTLMENKITIHETNNIGSIKFYPSLCLIEKNDKAITR